MSNKKISQLTELTSADSTDKIPILHGADSEAKYITKLNLIGTVGQVFYLSAYATFKLALDAVEAAGGGELIIDGGTWSFSAADRDIPSDIVMRVTAPTTIKVPDGAASSTVLFDITYKDNVSIIDPARVLTLDGNRDNRAEHTSAIGTNIQLKGAINYYIEVGMSKNAHGDGIYFGISHTNGQDYCENGVVPYIECYNCYRSGISLISAKNLKGGLWISRGNTGNVVGGVDKSNGFDIEPNYDYERLQNICIDTLITTDNAYDGVQTSINSFNYTTEGNIKINTIITENNGRGGVSFNTSGDDNVSFSKIHTEIGTIKAHKNDQMGVYFRAAENNCHIGTIWAQDNGQDGVADPALDSAVYFDHIGGVPDVKDLVIDTIYAVDTQASATQQYALYVEASTVSDGVVVTNLYYRGNALTKSVSDTDFHIINEHAW